MQSAVPSAYARKLRMTFGATCRVASDADVAYIGARSNIVACKTINRLNSQVMRSQCTVP